MEYLSLRIFGPAAKRCLRISAQLWIIISRYYSRGGGTKRLNIIIRSNLSWINALNLIPVNIN